MTVKEIMTFNNILAIVSVFLSIIFFISSKQTLGNIITNYQLLYIIPYLLLVWIIIRKFQCDCSNGKLIKINRKCLPDVDTNVLKKPLIPSLPYQNVKPKEYSTSFSDALSDFIKSSTVWETVIEKNISDDILDNKDLPRIFLVCEFAPIKIVENLLRDAFSFISSEKGNDAEAMEKKLVGLGNNYEEALSGKWQDEKDEEDEDFDSNKLIEKMCSIAHVLYPHFKTTNQAISQLKAANQDILKKRNSDQENRLRPSLEKYSQKAIVRILLWNNEGELYPSSAEKTERKHSALRQAFKLFKMLNGDVTCYIADVKSIQSRIDSSPTSSSFPFTDYAIIDRGNNQKKSKIEIWDFYSGSQILLIYGRNKNKTHRSTFCTLANDHKTSYEVLMNDWAVHASSESGYYRLADIPEKIKKFSPR